MNDGEEETPTKATQSQDGKDTARDATAYMLNLTREMEVTIASREGSGQVRPGQVRKRAHLRKMQAAGRERALPEDHAGSTARNG